MTTPKPDLCDICGEQRSTGVRHEAKATGVDAVPCVSCIDKQRVSFVCDLDDGVQWHMCSRGHKSKSIPMK